MFIGKKAQSTAEYAIVIGLVIAVAAGVMQQMLKGGMRQKNKQATDYLLSAGTAEGLPPANVATSGIYSQDWRKTTVAESTDEAVMKQGGGEEKKQIQKSSSSSVNIELIESVAP